MNTQLLIIDPQNDFCDILGAALPVPGANADMLRLATLMGKSDLKLDAVHVTLDSHNPVDIAHPGWWTNVAGEAPVPFTLISAANVESGLWQARDPAQREKSLAYVQQLEARGRYQLIIWPEHCLTGSWGQNVQPDLFAALNGWAKQQLKQVNYVYKGINPATEHYSAIAAEVPDAGDVATQPNRTLLNQLAAADTILIAGEALSHCVASTVRDMATHLGPDAVKKFVLLTDCTSPVSGFEAQGKTFIDELVAQGMRTVCSLDL